MQYSRNSESNYEINGNGSIYDSSLVSKEKVNFVYGNLQKITAVQKY